MIEEHCPLADLWISLRLKFSFSCLLIECVWRFTLRSAAVTSFPSSSPAGRKAFTLNVTCHCNSTGKQHGHHPARWTDLIKEAFLGENWLESLPSHSSGQINRWTAWTSCTNGLATRRYLMFQFSTVLSWHPYQFAISKQGKPADLNVWKNRLEVAKLDRGCRLPSSSRRRSRHWNSWSCPGTASKIDLNRSRLHFKFLTIIGLSIIPMRNI